MQGNLIIISSPSGGGKGTLIKEVLKDFAEYRILCFVHHPQDARR
ncbi:MAG: hypothetical protein WKF71_08430 [Pyrinomonadaceae bacterium]